MAGCISDTPGINWQIKVFIAGTWLKAEGARHGSSRFALPTSLFGLRFQLRPNTSSFAGTRRLHKQGVRKISHDIPLNLPALILLFPCITLKDVRRKYEYLRPLRIRLFQTITREYFRQFLPAPRGAPWARRRLPQRPLPRSPSACGSDRVQYY